MAEAFHSAVIQINVRDFDVRRKGVGIDRETMILACDGNFTAAEVFHWLIATTMAEFQLVSLSAESVTKHLVAEADR